MKTLQGILLIAFILAGTNHLNAQSTPTFGSRFIAGTSLTYILHKNEFDPFRFHEFTWNKNVAVSLSKNIYLGFGYQNIFTRGSVVSNFEKKLNFSTVGIFIQLDFMPKVKNRLFLETSWNYGNYCTCGNGDPYKKEALNYLGIGGGYDHPIGKYLSLDLSFISYNILDKIDRKYAYTQYVLGINLDLER